MKKKFRNNGGRWSIIGLWGDGGSRSCWTGRTVHSTRGSIQNQVSGVFFMDLDPTNDIHPAIFLSLS